MNNDQDATGSWRDREFELEGRRLGYPTHFRDGSSAMGVFSVPADVADSLIADSGFKTARIAPNRTALSLICVHYTDTDCGSYEEIALAFFVQRRGSQARQGVPYLSTWWSILRGDIASYTWCLPVSSSLSRDCGINMWGFPKTLERLDYELSEGRAKTSWIDEGKLVLSYSVPAQGEKSLRKISPPVYSLIDGEPYVSYLSQSYTGADRHGRDGLLELGDHPVADTLRQLELPKKPLIAAYNGHLQFEMSHPEPL